MIIASERVGGFGLPCRICCLFGDGLGLLGVGLLILENATRGDSDLLSRMHQRSLRKVKAGGI